MQKIPMTVRGYAAMQAELKKLKTVDRPQIINAIAEAREHGDLKENAEYHAAKDKQGEIEAKIAHYESKLTLAQVIDPAKLTGTTVQFGSTVTIVNEDTDEESTYQIVGEEEADIAEGRIYNRSPLARGMIGKEVGDVFEVNTPGGTRSYEILAIEYK